MRELTTRAGVELIQDFIGAAYWQRNLHCLKVGGRLVLVGLMGGTKVEADLGLILRQRLHIIGLVMRSQSLESKIAMTQRFRERWLPLLAQGHIRPIIDTSFPWPKRLPPISIWKTTATSARLCSSEEDSDFPAKLAGVLRTAIGSANLAGVLHLAQPGKQVILRTIDGDV